MNLIQKFDEKNITLLSWLVYLMKPVCYECRRGCHIYREPGTFGQDRVETSSLLGEGFYPVFPNLRPVLFLVVYIAFLSFDNPVDLT